MGLRDEYSKKIKRSAWSTQEILFLLSVFSMEDWNNLNNLPSSCLKTKPQQRNKELNKVNNLFHWYVSGHHSSISKAAQMSGTTLHTFLTTTHSQEI